ncbi:hypothetical protein DRN74_03745 [Candidatus Micrarchaeota archaeon]|nr:MAG: hypothetical protein DRN74_03745 [Candidatus Micrarchaeota archaeon]
MAEEDLQKQLVFADSLQRQLQNILGQKQFLELENVQINNSLAELEKAKGKVFKAVGNVLIEKDVKKLIDELNEKKKQNDEKIEKLKKQEEMINSKLTEVQKGIEEKLKNKKNE